MELWDVLDNNGQLTGETAERKADFFTLGNDRYHLVVVAWIYSVQDRCFLIQQRGFNKMIDPGVWSIPGGSAVAGETSEVACLREVKEEMGLDIDPSQMKFIKRYKRRTDFCDAWFIEIDKCIITDYDRTEVANVRWERPGTIINMMEDRQFSAHWDILDALKFTEGALQYEKK